MQGFGPDSNVHYRFPALNRSEETQAFDGPHQRALTIYEKRLRAVRAWKNKRPQPPTAKLIDYTPNFDEPSDVLTLIAMTGPHRPLPTSLQPHTPFWVLDCVDADGVLVRFWSGHATLSEHWTDAELRDALESGVTFPITFTRHRTKDGTKTYITVELADEPVYSEDNPDTESPFADD